MPPRRLPSGQTVYTWGAASYNKLRRATALDIRIALSIRPDACFVLADDPLANLKALQVGTQVSSRLSATLVKQTDRGKHTEIKGERVSHCSPVVEATVRVLAPLDQPMGMQKVSIRIQWQAVTVDGASTAQSTDFEFPVEVVERDDRTAQYNESYGFRPKPDLLWRIPAFPFVLVYCVAVGGDCPD